MNEPCLLRAIKELNDLAQALAGKKKSASRRASMASAEEEIYRQLEIDVSNRRYHLEKEAGIKQ